MGIIISFFTKSLFAGLICFFSGVLLDIDHIIEYIVHFGWRNFTLKGCYEECERIAKGQGELRFKKMYLIFHSAELIFILWLASFYTKNIYLFSAALGYSLHLVLDCIGNQLYPQAYFILWRTINNFPAWEVLKRKK